MFASNTGMTSIVRLLLTHDLNLHLTSTVGRAYGTGRYHRSTDVLVRSEQFGVVGPAARQGRLPARGRGRPFGDLRADPPQG